MTVSVTPKELRSSMVSDWYSDLTDIGADVSLIDDVYDQWVRSVNIGARVRGLRALAETAPRTPLEAAALTIARGEQYDADGVKVAILSRDELTLEIEAHDLAMEQAGELAFRILASRKDRNVTELLRPAYMDAAENMLRLRAVLGSVTITLEEATRRGVAAEWLELEKEYGRIVKIHGLHDQWLADGVIHKTGARLTNPYTPVYDRYSVSEVFFEDRMVAYIASGQAGTHGMFGTANLFAAAKPALRTLAEIDALWKSSPNESSASAEMGRALGGKPQHWDAAKEAAHSAYMKSQNLTPWRD